MEAAALLIDWENLVGRLSEDPWWTVDISPYIPKLVAAIEEHARQQGASLNYRGFFLPGDRNFARSTADALRQSGFTRNDSSRAKNASDTTLIFRAAQLAFHNVAPYRLFYVVTGDEDFFDLAQELRHATATCFLCPVDERRLKGPMQEWPQKLYIRDLIKLQPGAPPEANDLDQFVLCLQRLSDDGDHFGSRPIAERMLVEKFKLWDLESVGVLFTAATEEGLLWQSQVLVQGEMKNRRRLAYEDTRVSTLLTLADKMIDQIERQQGVATHGQLVGALDDVDTRNHSALPEMLVSANYFRQTGDRFSFAFPTARYGTLNLLRRIALITEHQCAIRPTWDGVGPRIIRSRWSRQIPPPRHGHPPPDPARVEGEAAKMIERAVASSVILGVGGASTGKPFGYRNNDEHPVVAQTREAVTSILKHIPHRGTVARASLLDDLARDTDSLRTIGTGTHEHLFWLRTMAGEQVIDMFEGKVQRNRNSPLAREASA